MNLLFIDIDTLRADHLGCYGYHRNTTPAMDSVSRDGIRMESCFTSDAPCLPSRSALQHGRFGIHNGAINHGGRYADPYPEGPTRDFQNSEPYKKFYQVLRDNGYYTGTTSSFAGRHNAWWFLAGFNEVYDCGGLGNEPAPWVTPKALDFIDRNHTRDKWVLHFNIWDPHTAYRTPAEFGDPFKDDPVASWVTQEMIDRHQDTYGPHGALLPLDSLEKKPTPREVSRIATMEDYTKWINGYDTGIRFADDAVGQLIARLKHYGIYDNTAIIITADHGENQGEFNIYGDHQTADLCTSRVPMIVKLPGFAPAIDTTLHYQFDITATLLELLEIPIPEKWDAQSFAPSLKRGRPEGRDYLVVSQSVWSCQRSVVRDDSILIKTYMDGLKDFPEYMLFDRIRDPHEQHNLAGSMPDKVEEGKVLLEKWIAEQLACSDVDEDPMMKVIEEGGPFHSRNRLGFYVDFYNSIGKEHLARRMKEKYEGIKGY